MDSIAQLYAHFKGIGADIANVTRKEIIEAGYDGNCNPDLIASDVRRMHGFEQNPPKRPSRPKRKRRTRKDTGRRNQKQSASTVFHSQLQAAATLELMERVNGDQEDTEVDDNPLRLFNTAPGEQYPRFVVIRPETPANVPEDLADALPDTGFRMTDYEERQPW